jgi:two-component SAPR family response regulator
LADTDIQTSEFDHDTWNGYIMLGFVSAHIPLNALSNLELQQSYMALHDDSVLPSADTLNEVCCREYALTVDAMKKLLPS